MIYYNYYLEIKYRFSLIVFTWFSVSFTCYFYREVLIFEIIDLTNYVGFSKTNPYFIFSDITDIFSISVILSCFVSNQICFFLFLYHFLVFLSPGLYSKEYYNFFNILKISFVYWIIAILFLNYRSGSTAKAWTLVRTPERTRNVPSMLIENATTPNMIVHARKASRAARTLAECSNAVAASHGISDAFSTGSQNHQPPQPSS